MTNKQKHEISISSYHTNFDYLFDVKDKKLPHWTSVTTIEKINEIKKFAMCGYRGRSTLIWKHAKQLDTLEILYKRSYRGQLMRNNFSFDKKEDQIKDIRSGLNSYLILTQLGNVYSLSDKTVILFNGSTQVPKMDSKLDSYEKIRLVEFFKNKNLSVQAIAMTARSNYFLCSHGVLYGSGQNDGLLGDGTDNGSKKLPILIYQKVSRIFGGVDAKCFFLTTYRNELFAAGENKFGQCSVGNNKNWNYPKMVPNWKADDILDLCCLKYHTILITYEGNIFSCGSGSYNGIGEHTNNFREMYFFRDKKAIQINGGSVHTLVLTSNSELYGWGFDDMNHPTNQYQTTENVDSWSKPRKINLPQNFQSGLLNPYNFKINCGNNSIFLYYDYNDCLIQDFQNLLLSKEYCDSYLSIKNLDKIPIQKVLLELRTHIKLDEFQKIIDEKGFTKNTIKIFLQWVYCDQASNSYSIKQIFNLINLEYPPKKYLENDLLTLYEDEESKDFKILVQKKNNNTVKKNRWSIMSNKDKKQSNLKKNNKNNGNDNDKDKDKDNGEEEDDDDDDDNYEEILVHKFILMARSGLFRGFFGFVQENQNEKKMQQVKDYSGKSIDTLKTLIKYFYTNKIELKELKVYEDPELIVDELFDAVEYYQLNDNSNLINYLDQIKLKF
ncbi:claret isoform a [Anaeramoeba flamelloides]|uniref:Claret isoform a n=1 Tax=Anaeramoeba flamelloides TaxID=1746091 RepID=A0AAV7YDZ2_9EUKA|nr:claret isoform a [Anaeramoeba flamelloides]